MTANLVQYHHPDDYQFSLDFVNPNYNEIENQLALYDDETETRVRSYDLDEKVYVIYTKSSDVDTTQNLRYAFETAFAEMDPDTRVIARETLEVFKRIQERKHDEEGVPLDAYKRVEIDRVPDALERINWSATVPETSGQLASNLILCHALPNANHRTAFGMLGAYLKSVDSGFNLPSMITENYNWQRWVDEYIVGSKRLLTVRRNVGPFRYLQSYGCETVQRKGGIEIQISEYDLDMPPHEALTNYAKGHERRTIEFVETVLKKTDRSELIEKASVEKEPFAEYLRQLD